MAKKNRFEEKFDAEEKHDAFEILRKSLLRDRLEKEALSEADRRLLDAIRKIIREEIRAALEKERQQKP